MRQLGLLFLALLLGDAGAYAQGQFAGTGGSQAEGVVVACAGGGAAQPCGTAESPLHVDQGSSGAGTTLPAGGAGVIGWLSAIYAQLQALAVTSTPGTGTLIDNSTASLGPTSTTLLMACGSGTAQQTGCAVGNGRSRSMVLNQGATNACLNYGLPAAFLPGSSSNCAAGSLLLPANGGGLDDTTGVVSSQQVNVICAGPNCTLTVKSY